MNGLKEALEYAVGLSEPNYTEHEGEKWADKQMYRIHHKKPKAEPIEMNTLTGLLDYIQSNTDQMAEHMIIHVQSPTKVSLYSQLDGDRIRETLVKVEALLPQFDFGRYYPAEIFVINVMSKFIGESTSLSSKASDQLPWKEEQGQDPSSPLCNDKETILKYAGTVETGTIAQYGDDGVSQKATIQQTTTSKEDVIIPSPVQLIPYRTFLEIEQPGSNFIFRMRDVGHGEEPEMALFEADGGAWQIDAMKSIHSYLEAKLKEVSIENVTFTVIS